MNLPAPTKRDPKHLQTLYHIIMNRQLTSVELSRLTNVGYSPRKVQRLEELGLVFKHELVPYTTSEGIKTKVARYRLKTHLATAKKIYKQLVKG